MSRILLCLSVLLIIFVSAVSADGLLLPVERPHSMVVVPDELFTVKYHHVDVDISDQLSSTRVDQMFHNESSVEREGMYIFPMPEGSVINKFSMYAGEQEIKGKVLEKNEARQIYESIVRQRKDPALLEYIDRNTFRASVYPIPANGDKRIKLSYGEVLDKVGETYRYVYSLSTERFSKKPLEDCRVKIDIKSKRPITNIYSPTHQVQVERSGDYEATVLWEAKNVKPDTDLVLYYTVSEDDLGMELLSFAGQGEDGYFMLLASPRVKLDKAKVLPKNVVFVLDRTGSMAGEKIEQARDALKFCLNSLREGDSFNVITFNESPTAVFTSMTKLTSETRKQALSAVDGIEATGGTNINEALTAAMNQFNSLGDTRNYVIFLTDGLPTVGETDIDSILRNANSANKNRVKMFSFGVGYDVNTHLLDKLAEGSRGDADYVRPSEDIEVKVGSFFGKVSEPLLADVELKINGVKTSDIYPKVLPDIFKGSQLIILGRYSGSGNVTVELSGRTNGERKTFTLKSKLMQASEEHQFMPQLWASRKIGYLLDEIRLHRNQELIDEVVRLSKDYGIPTEFTSFLADERGYTFNLDSSIRRAEEAFDKAGQVQTGTHGVSQSSNAYAMKDQAQSPQAAASKPAPGGVQPSVIGTIAANGRFAGMYYDSNDRPVVVANVQNIARRTFYQRGAYWEDANLSEKQQFVQVKQFSDAHFKLLRAYPRLAQYSTLGNVRVTLENSQGLEIGPEGKDTMSDKEIEELLKGISAEVRQSSSGHSVGLAGLAVLAACVPTARRARKS